MRLSNILILLFSFFIYDICGNESIPTKAKRFSSNSQKSFKGIKDLSLFDGEDRVLYACNENPYEDQLCSCETETQRLTCWRILPNPLKHANIQIRNSNFVVKNASFAFNSITKLQKDKILPGREVTIESLDFSRNKISSIEIGTFEKFISLKTLNFGENSITFISSEIFTPKLGSTLLSLDVSENKFQKLSSIAFQNLVKLKSLSLAINKQIGFSSLESIFPEALANLKQLDLSSCYIRNLNNENIFVNLKNLEILILKENPLSSIPRAINILSSLKHLDLSLTNVAAINNNETFTNLSNLEELHFDGTNIEIIDDCTFCNLPNLKEIHLDFNPLLSEIHENAFGSINTDGVASSLEKFYIQSCNLSFLPEKLLNWKNTQNIRIENNPFICDCSIAWLINDPILLSRISSNGSFSDEFIEEPQCFAPEVLENVKFVNVPKPFCGGNSALSNQGLLHPHFLWFIIAFYYAFIWGC